MILKIKAIFDRRPSGLNIPQDNPPPVGGVWDWSGWMVDTCDGWQLDDDPASLPLDVGLKGEVHVKGFVVGTALTKKAFGGAYFHVMISDERPAQRTFFRVLETREGGLIGQSNQESHVTFFHIIDHDQHMLKLKKGDEIEFAANAIWQDFVDKKIKNHHFDGFFNRKRDCPVVRINQFKRVN